MSEIEYDDRRQLWHRPGTYDLRTAAAIRGSYGALQLKLTDIVLDIGGHIGSFAVWAAPQVKRVVSYEPYKDSYQLLVRNVKDHRNARAVNAALSTQPKGLTSFYLNKGMNQGLHSLVYHRGRKMVEALTLEFKSVLSAEKPSIIKMDIEGGEYELLAQPLPRCVKQLALELHLTRRTWRREATVVMKHLAAQGFKMIRPPTLTDKSRATVTVLRR